MRCWNILSVKVDLILIAISWLFFIEAIPSWYTLSSWNLLRCLRRNQLLSMLSRFLVSCYWDVCCLTVSKWFRLQSLRCDRTSKV